MANVNAAYGLRPIRHLTGGEIRTNQYPILTGYAANIFTGDPVKLVTATGTLNIAAGGDTDAIGVFAGCSYVNASGEEKFSKYWPTGTAGTDITAFVYDDPNIIFAIQSDATGITQADVGAQADWEIVAGSTSIGISLTNLDASAYLGATASGLRVLRIIEMPDNEAGAYADVEVQFAQHAFNSVPAGI